MTHSTNISNPTLTGNSSCIAALHIQLLPHTANSYKGMHNQLHKENQLFGELSAVKPDVKSG
jgi:hypothetical protein